MGTICSSSSGERRKRSKGKSASAREAARESLTSSSEVAVQVAGRKGQGGGKTSPNPPPSSGTAPTFLGKPSAGGGPPTQRSPCLGITPDLSVVSSPTDKSDLCTDKCLPLLAVPESLQHVPSEMQNLLMGRWPVPPIPGGRILRLFIAAEEEDSQTERTWLAKRVFPGLRLFSEKQGFHLKFVDTYCLLPTPCAPHKYIREITRRAMDNSINLWLIILNSKLGWRLPTAIAVDDFREIRSRLAEKDVNTASILDQAYELDENNVPPLYVLAAWRPDDDLTSGDRQRLYDELCYVVDERQDALYMNEGFHEEATKALDNHAGMSDNILVIRRHVTNLPSNKTSLPNRRHLDIDSDGETHQQLIQKHRMLAARVEHIVSNVCICKWSPSWSELESSSQGHETRYVTSLCQTMEDKLTAAVSRMVERHASVDPYLSVGLPSVLCQELLVHSHKQQALLRACPEAPPIVLEALDRLHDNPNTTLILRGDVGSGLQTIAAHIAYEEARWDLTRMLVLRFLTLTPESQTLSAALFTVLEQVFVATSAVEGFSQLKSMSAGDLLQSIALCASRQAVTIVLCGVESALLQEAGDTGWISHDLPPNVSVVVLTGSTDIASQYLEIPLMQEDQIRRFFLASLQSHGRCITPLQQAAVDVSLVHTPLPVMAVLMATLAVEWTPGTHVDQAHLPRSVDDCLVQLFRQAEGVIGQNCLKRILCYLDTAKFGLSDSEMEDVLSLDDSLMSSLYPDRLPLLRRCPLSIWLYVKHKFAPILDTAHVYGHCVHRWQRRVIGSLAFQQYGLSPQTFHSQLAEYFRGRWETEPKPMPDPSKANTMVAVPCAVMAQPNSYQRHVNCRKFMCLLHHMLQGLSTVSENEDCPLRCCAAKQHLLDLRWLVTKMDATSLVQLLDDLQMAMSTTRTMSKELLWLRLLIARKATVLNVSGRQLRSCLYSQIKADRAAGERAQAQDSESHHRKVSFLAAVEKLEAALGHSTFLVLADSRQLNGDSSSSSTNTAVVPDSKPSDVDPAPPPVPCFTGFFSVDKAGRRVVSISKLAGEICVWDTVQHRVVQTISKVNKPSDLVFLDEQRVVVLCDRELKTFNLDTGQLESSIRGMLNIKMPYFHKRDAHTVIVLARNRMSVNVLDVASSKIHATFKAGEDRFLNSLLVSGNGRMLVCGDETQKPFPLLVWELGQAGKLLHDLRMPQHEFITKIADITYDGHFVACACRGLYDTANTNFVVVYDLTSGQLYRQFRMHASVTAVAVASVSPAAVMALNDGSLAIYDILTGNCRCHVSGVKAIFNRVNLSSDEKLAVTFSKNAGTLPIACTVALWNVDGGKMVASYTFDCAVTCCLHMAHNESILVGLRDWPSSRYAILSVFGQNTDETRASVDFSKDRSVSDMSGSLPDQPLWRVV